MYVKINKLKFFFQNNSIIIFTYELSIHDIHFFDIVIPILITLEHPLKKAKETDILLTLLTLVNTD